MDLRRSLALAVVALTASCSSIKIAMPPIERLGRESYVRAWDEATAERLASACERLAPRVRELKGVEKPSPLVIASREHLPGSAIGLEIETGIILDPDTRRWEAWYLAHELSHWFSDDRWRRLPHALEEGLADHVASLVVPVDASRRLNARIFDVPESVDRSSFGDACAQDLTLGREIEAKEEDRLRAIGHVAATEIGIPGLRGLCDRAAAEGLDTVPSDWIYDALPFPAAELGAWRAAHHRHMFVIEAEAARIEKASATASTPAAVPQSR